MHQQSLFLNQHRTFQGFAFTALSPKKKPENHRKKVLLLMIKSKSTESIFPLRFSAVEKALLLHKFTFCKNVEIQVNFNFAGYQINFALKLETNPNENHNFAQNAMAIFHHFCINTMLKTLLDFKGRCVVLRFWRQRNMGSQN